MERDGVTPDQTVFVCLIDYLLNIYKLAEAKQALSMLMKSGLPPTTSVFRVVIRVYQAEGNRDAAESVYHGAPLHPRKNVNHNEIEQKHGPLVASLVSLPSGLNALEDFSVFIQPASPIPSLVFDAHVGFPIRTGILFRPGIQLTADVFNAMLSLYADEKDFEKIDQVLKVMAFRGVSRDVDTYEVLINLWASVGDSRKATEVRHEGFPRYFRSRGLQASHSFCRRLSRKCFRLESSQIRICMHL
jgi:pentatricopeptide repeat protein